MRLTRAIENSCRYRLAAGSWHFPQSRAQLRRVNNDAVAAPCSTTAVSRNCKGAQPTTVQIEPFQLVPREETDRAAVGRPEWKLRPVGILQHSSILGIERAQPQALFSFGNRDESNISAVRRDGAAESTELRFGGCADFELNESGAWLAVGEQPGGQGEHSAEKRTY